MPARYKIRNFYRGIPEELREELTGFKPDKLKELNTLWQPDRLDRLSRLGRVSGRYTGIPESIRIMPPGTRGAELGGLVLYIRPDVRIRLPVDERLLEAINIDRSAPDRPIKLIAELEELRKDTVRAIEITGASSTGKDSKIYRLKPGKFRAIRRKPAKPGTEYREEATELIGRLREGKWPEVLAGIFGIPESKELLRAFLPRFLTLAMPTPEYGEPLGTARCPALLQIHPPGTGKSRTVEVLREILPGTKVVTGTVTRTGLIRDGQLRIEGPVYRARTIVRDEFGTMKLDRAQAAELEGVLKSGIISGHRTRAGAGTRAGRKAPEKVNYVYRLRFSNPVRVTKGSRVEYRPTSSDRTLAETGDKIFGRLGRNEGNARLRRFSRIDITRHGYAIPGVSDGTQALRKPTGELWHPKTILTVFDRLRRHPEFFEHRDILRRTPRGRLPTIRDEFDSTKTLDRLDSRRWELVDRVTTGMPSESITGPMTGEKSEESTETTAGSIEPEESAETTAGEGSPVDYGDSSPDSSTGEETEEMPAIEADEEAGIARIEGGDEA